MKTGAILLAAHDGRGRDEGMRVASASEVRAPRGYCPFSNPALVDLLASIIPRVHVDLSSYVYRNAW